MGRMPKDVGLLSKRYEIDRVSHDQVMGLVLAKDFYTREAGMLGTPCSRNTM